MKRVEIIFDEAHENELMMILRQNGIENYTRLDSVRGHGGAGSKLNNAVGPGINSLLLLYLEEDRIENLVHSVTQFKTMAGQKGGHAGVCMAISPLDKIL